MSKKKKNINYIPEICLNSELQLRNNSLLLKSDPSLENHSHLKTLMKLRDKYTELDYSSDDGLQELKKRIRDLIRTISSKTFVKRDNNIFGGMLLLVINKLATSGRFSGYDFLPDMKALAIEHVLSYAHKYDPFRRSTITGQYSSAFAYITTICFNAFIATINKQKQENDKIKTDFLENQKAFHNDPNKSTTDEDHSEIDEVIHVNHINNSLVETIEKMNIINNSDIMVIYPNEYNISMGEYKEITDFSSVHNIRLSVIKDKKEQN